MAVYTPPTETLPIFDNGVFPASLTGALTPSTGTRYFLSYPVAQGIETIEKLRTNFIDTFGVLSNLVITSINNMTLNSGRAITLTSNNDMTLTSTSGNTLITTSTGTFGISSASTSTIQSSGSNILRSNTGDTSVISSTGNVSVIGDVNASISGRTGSTTIGIAGTSVSIPGGLTIGANKNIILGDGSNITLSSVQSNPTSAQMGYSLSSSVSNQALTTTTNNLISFGNIPIGIYLFTFNTCVTSFTVGAAIATFTIGTLNITSSVLPYNVGAAGSNAQIPVVFTGVVKPTNASNSMTIACVLDFGNATAFRPNYTLLRIA